MHSSRLFPLAAIVLLFPLAVVAQQPGAAGPVSNGSEAQTPAPIQRTQPILPGQSTPNADGTVTFRTSTRIVVLDTVVTDAKGNLITDLTKDDFHVTEAGEAQTITNFEVASKRIPSPEVTIDSTADLDRLAPRAPVNIILLDEFNTRFEDEAFARYSLKKFLQRQPDKLALPTILIAVSIDKFEVLHDYTQNKQAVIDALDHHFVANPWRNTSNSWAAERLGTAFLTLRRVAEATIGHQGHKNMIWIGRGFPALDFSRVAVDTSNRVENEVQRCVNALRDARITLTTIDPAGLLVDQYAYGSVARFEDPFGGNYEFAKLARATGGRTIYGRNDVDAQIAAAAADGANFYTLVYRPTSGSENPAKFRKIVVTVDRPGAVVTTREGYYLSRGPGRVDPAAPNRRLVSDLVSAESSTMVYDGVEMTMTPVADRPNVFKLHIAPRSLAWTPATDTEPRKAEVILMVTTFDKKGKELKRVARDLTVKAAADVPPTGRIERALDINYTLDPDPKAKRVRFVVRVAASGRIGTADLDLTQQAAQTPVPVATP
jgi:VWFA-related protein